ncbi:hypothetical protein ACFPRL_34110 [Pseudoclavibacter helvolus]
MTCVRCATSVGSTESRSGSGTEVSMAEKKICEARYGSRRSSRLPQWSCCWKRPIEVVGEPSGFVTPLVSQSP